MSESKREMIASKVGEDFRALSEDEKRSFVDDSLRFLLAMRPKQAKRLLKKFFKKGRPSATDLEDVNQLIIVFLYSIKTEFRYHYASMIYQMLKQPVPEDLPEKLERVKQVKFVHIPMLQETYSKLEKAFEKLKISFDEEDPEPWAAFFNHALSTLASEEKAVPKGKGSK